MTDHELRRSVEELMAGQADLRTKAEDVERSHRRDRDNLLRQILEIADGVERSRALSRGECTNFLDAIAQQIEETVVDQGLVAFRPTVGEQVSGLTHEVMATVVNAALRPGSITRLIRAGYRDGQRIVRRAGVEIVKE